MATKVHILELHDRTIPFFVVAAVVLAGALWAIVILSHRTMPPGSAPSESVRLSDVRRFVDDGSEYPNVLELTIETNAKLQPVAFVAQFDGEVGMGTAVIRNGGAYLHYARVKQGVPTGHRNWFAFEWDTPAFGQDSPVIVTVYSRQPVHLSRLDRVAYEWP